MTATLHHSLEALRVSLINGKLPRNLSWAHVIELIDHMGTAEANGDSEFVFHVGSQRSTFRKPNGHDLGVEEVARLRKFLRDAELDTALHQLSQPGRMIVVIDHHAAHIYQDMGGSRPVDEHSVRPYDPFGFHHHLIHRKEAHYRGERVPEENSFYEDIAKDLVHATELVIVGHAKGTSNAATYLNEFLKSHHPDLFRNVIATESADLSAVTEPEIEALAKTHMIAVV
jgi:hypothetical protein